jgi:hypothetical protein
MTPDLLRLRPYQAKANDWCRSLRCPNYYLRSVA